MNYNANKHNSRVGRKRSFPTSDVIFASAVALSMSCASAFQNSLPLVERNFVNAPSQTMLRVVTDPKRFLETELSERDRSDVNVLESIYLLSNEHDGLNGLVVEELTKKNSPKSSEKTKIEKRRTKEEDGRSRAGSRVQFKGLSLTPNRRNSRSKKKNSLSTTPPTERSLLVNEDRATTSRSSTMPGFKERSSTYREKAFRDGIRLAEQRSGKKFVDTSEAKQKRRQINGETMYKLSASVPESMMQFANEIHDVDRITPKEEVVLGEKTQEAIRLQKIYDGLVLQLDRDPTDEEWCAAAGKINMEAISQTIEEGLEAKNQLVTSNLRMVQGVVNVYIRNGLRGQYNAGDLMQEGVMALIRAAEKFDPSRGFRFSTYAMYWIRSAIKRDQIFQSRVVNVPQRLYENHKRIRRVQKELTQGLGRPPTKKELSEAVGMSEVQIDRCLTAMSQKCYSLDQQVANPLKPMSSSSEDTMYELVESQTDDSDDNKLKHSLLREDLIDTLYRHLTEEETKLLLLRYGLLDTLPQNLKNGPLTIAEVSRMVGLKPDKVRRMLNKSLKHLKAVMGTDWADYERELK